MLSRPWHFLTCATGSLLPNTQAVQTRRGFTAGAVIAAGALVFPLGEASAAVEKMKVTIAVGGKASFSHLPLTIAEQLGYFRAEGLELEIIDFPGEVLARQAVAAGSFDVCAGAYEHTLQLQAGSQLFQSIVMQGRAPQIALGVSTKAVPNYRSVADLRGLKIGVSAPGSSTEMMASLVLLRGGLKPHEATFVGVGHAGGALYALRAGHVDAMCHVDPVMTMLEQKAEVRIISDTRTLKGTTELFGGPMPAACLYAPRDFVLRHPNTCQALANGIVRALKWLQTAGPQDIIKTVPEKYLLEDRGLYLASFAKVRESLSIDGLMPEEGPRTAWRAMRKFDPAFQSDKISLPRTFTNEFAVRARQRYAA